MKKYLIYTDVHWCKTSSIIKTIGKNYTTRLENLINSVSWAEEQALVHNCDEIICLGDFFDKDCLQSEEITALDDVKWADLPHTFIIGNHESPHKQLHFNTARVLSKLGFNIIDKVTYQNDLLFIPYLQDDIRKSIADYKKDFNITTNPIVLSHNDVKGIQYGPVISRTGIELDDIENNCRLFLNGHIHNGSKICKNGFNLGNLTGKVFEENAFKYIHPAVILTVDEEVNIEFLENPYAFNFYQLDLSCIDGLQEKLSTLKNNAILSVKVPRGIASEVKDILNLSQNVLLSKLVIKPEVTKLDGEVSIEKLNDVNHLDLLEEFTLAKLGNSEEVRTELSKLRN